MPRCWIALGGNLGDVTETFRRARQRLADQPGIALGLSSRLYRSQPMGVAAGQAFFNAALEITCDWSPERLLDLLQKIEQECGRARTVTWGPRTLDLDWIGWDRPEMIATPRLTLPHPHAWYRRFVLDPLTDIAPDWVMPWKNATVTDLLARLRDRLVNLGVTTANRSDAEAIVASVKARRPEMAVSVWTHGAPEPTLLLWADAQPVPSHLPRLPLLIVPAGDPVQFVIDAWTAATDTPQLVGVW